jgi:hypothetical protein
MTKKIEEECDGCDGSYEYEPVTEFDGDYGEPGEYDAVSVGTNVAVNPLPMMTGPEISVYIKDFEQVSTGVHSSDLTEFCLNFIVSSYTGGVSHQYTVKKRIVVSKQSLLAQGIEDNIRTPATMVEGTNKSKPVEKPMFNRSSDLQRAREIAGVSHRKNYT